MNNDRLTSGEEVHVRKRGSRQEKRFTLEEEVQVSSSSFSHSPVRGKVQSFLYFKVFVEGAFRFTLYFRATEVKQVRIDANV